MGTRVLPVAAYRSGFEQHPGVGAPRYPDEGIPTGPGGTH